MITLILLDAQRHCLHQAAEMPHYVCRARRGHAGPHEYVPTDMVMIADQAEPAPRPLQPVID